MNIEQLENGNGIMKQIEVYADVLRMLSADNEIRVVGQVQYKDPNHPIGWKLMHNDGFLIPLPEAAVVEMKRYYEKQKAILEAEFAAL